MASGEEGFVIDLSKANTGIAGVRIRANDLTKIELSGLQDLVFRNFALLLTAQPLTRDMALPEWGTAVKPGTPAYYFFPGRTRIERVTVSAPCSLSVFSGGAELDFGQITAGENEIAFEADFVKVAGDATELRVQLWSNALPSLLGYLVGYGLTVSTFPGTLQPGSSRQSPDLTDALDQARAQSGGTSVPLFLTAGTDCQVDLRLLGHWSQQSSPPAVYLDMDGVQAAYRVPCAPPADGGRMTISVAGAHNGPGRLGLVEPGDETPGQPPDLSETEQVAEVMGRFSAAWISCKITAVWLGVRERRPAALQLSLAPAPNGGSPARDLYATFPVQLPGEESAYVTDGQVYWYRVELSNPIVVPDVQHAAPIAVVAGGVGLGNPPTLVCGKAGEGCPTWRRNLAEGPGWNPAGFTWLVDLEAEAVTRETPKLEKTGDGEFTVSGVQPQQYAVELAGEEATPDMKELKLRFASRQRGTATVQLTFAHVCVP